MAKRYIYLVRHGQYNLTRREQGELTERGLEQAQTTGFALRHIPFSLIISSPVLRAQQTADIIAQTFPNAERRTEPRLRECIPLVTDELLPYFQELYPEQNVDRMTQCTDLLNTVFNEYFIEAPPPTDKNEYWLMVCHGNVIRHLVSQVFERNSRAWMRMLINNCGICRVLVEAEGQLFLASHNDVGHLTPDLLTEN